MNWHDHIIEVYTENEQYRVVGVKTMMYDNDFAWYAEIKNDDPDKELFPYKSFQHTSKGFAQIFPTMEAAMSACSDHFNGAGVLVG